MDPTECTFTTNQLNPSTKEPIRLERSVGSGFPKHKIYIGSFMPPETLLGELAPAVVVSNVKGASNQILCAVMQYDSYLEINTCTRKVRRVPGKKQ